MSTEDGTEVRSEHRLEMALAGIRLVIDERQEQRVATAARLVELDAELKRLRVAERALGSSADAPVEVVVKRRTRGPAKKVPTADAVHKIMTELHTATQAQVAERLGKPKNTAKHALEALVKRGVVVPTGAFVKRSPEFALADS